MKFGLPWTDLLEEGNEVEPWSYFGKTGQGQQGQNYKPLEEETDKTR